MRVAVFIKRTTFHEGYGGMETQNKVLCEGLASRDYDITVFSPKRELTFNSKENSGVHYIFVDSVYRTLFSTVNKKNWFFESAKVFEKEHTKKNFDIVISQSSAGVGIIRKKDVYKVPIISITHGSIMSELKTRYANLDGIRELVKILPDTMFGLHVFFGRQREFVHGSDLIISVSSYVKNVLLEETFASEEKFRVINNGIDVSKFSKKPDFDSELDPGVLFVGRLEKEKGVDVLVEMAKDESFQDIRFDIFGSGSKEDYLYDILQASKDTGASVEEVEKTWDQAARDFAGVKDNFLIHGNVAYEEVLKHYSPNSVFIFPSNRVEGFPMVLPEAMCGGCAIVAYDIGGVSDAITNNQTGILVKSGNIDLFKNEVHKLLNDKKLRIELGKNARMKANEEFSIDTMLDKYEVAIKELVG